MNIREWIPSRGNLLLTIIVVIGWVWVQQTSALNSNNAPVAATSIGTIPYQGRLADATGVPITANVPMVFRLYTAATGGIALWQETWSNTNLIAIDNGLFNVMLGSITPIPQSVVAANNSLWLGITVDADAEMTSRVQLGSVVYAMQALTVVDSSISSAKIIDGTIANTDMAANAINSTNIVDATIATADIADNAITSAKIADGVITSNDILNATIANADIAVNAINSTNIVDGTIANTDMAANAINGTNIVDATIATADIADNAITSAKIADGVITSNDILNGTIANSDLGANTINSTNIVDATIATADIADSAITSAKIADGVITSNDILNGTIANSDLGANTINNTNIIDGQVMSNDIGSDSITSGKILDGTIIGADLANATINSQKVTLTSNYVQSSGTFATTTGFQQIPEVSSTVNPGINQYAYVYAMIDGVTTNDSGTIVGYIFINGSPIGTPIAIGVLGQTQRSSAIGFARIPISGSNQTIALHVRTEVDNGATIYNGAIMYFLAAQ